MTGDNILDIITEPLTRGEGMRHLWLGDSRMGKTYANRALLKYILAHNLTDIILTLDDKDRWKVQYDTVGGLPTVRRNPDDVKSRPPQGKESPKHLVFRGIMLDGNWDMGVEPASVAKMAQGLVVAHPHTRVLINIDELSDATNGSQAWSEDTIPQVYRKGGGVGISITATTQLPQSLPREAFGLSETIGIFRMSAREAAYLAKYRVIDPEDIEAISKQKVGDFRLFRKSMPKDTTVHKL